MDPNANLEEQLELATFLAESDSTDATERLDVAVRLADLVLALDGWIRKGGFLPGKWKTS